MRQVERKKERGKDKWKEEERTGSDGRYTLSHIIIYFTLSKNDTRLYNDLHKRHFKILPLNSDKN